MATLSEARVLGGIGSILLILSLVPNVGPILGIVGFILLLIAIKYISDIVGDEQIFKNMLIAVILAIVGLFSGIIIGGAAIFSLLSGGLLTRGIAPPANFLSILFGAFFIHLMIAFIIVWIFMIISAIFFRKSLDSIASKLNIGMFSTAGIIYLIGAIIPVIGFIVMIIAAILLAVAFFSIPEKPP
ncbi:MAG: hypothetical protein DRN49_04255 [Thaumarchaeota archaeon]|nr:MAG: hypothetical protein DRN49_04255 [Nitrososphaerota archaeon]